MAAGPCRVFAGESPLSVNLPITHLRGEYEFDSIANKLLKNLKSKLFVLIIDLGLGKIKSFIFAWQASPKLKPA